MFQTANAEIIAGIFSTDPTTLEALRIHHCPCCRAANEQGKCDEERAAICIASRCGLCVPGELDRERQIAAYFLDQLTPPKQPTAADVEAFNHHLLSSASVSAALTQDEAGRLRLSWAHPTLRGALHAAILGWVAVFAGEHPINVFEKNAEAIRAEVGRKREEFETYFSEQAKLRAARLRDEGVSDNQIAKLIGVTNKTIRDWLEPASNWANHRERWYRQHGHSPS